MRMAFLAFGLMLGSAGSAVYADQAPTTPRTYKVSQIQAGYGRNVASLPGYNLPGANDGLAAYTFNHIAQNGSALPYGLLSWTVGEPMIDTTARSASQSTRNGPPSFGYDKPRNLCVVTSQGSRCSNGDGLTSNIVDGNRDKAHESLGEFNANARDGNLARPQIEIGAPVPEPEQWLQLLAGFGALAWFFRRTRQGASAIA